MIIATRLDFFVVAETAANTDLSILASAAKLAKVSWRLRSSYFTRS